MNLLRRLSAAWRHWREVRDFDRACTQGIPVEIITPPEGIKVRVSSPFRLVTTPPTRTAGTSSSTYVYTGGVS